MVKFKLDEILENTGISRYKLGKETGIDSNTINRIFKNETTAIKLDILEKICTATGCSIADLMVIEKEEQ